LIKEVYDKGIEKPKKSLIFWAGIYIKIIVCKRPYQNC